MKKATMTIGCDLGDKFTQICVLDAEGEVVEENRIQTTMTKFRRYFEGMGPYRVVLEVGPHSRWTSELIASLGHEVLVANPRQVGLIWKGRSKSDSIDAEKLARLGRLDPKLLAAIQHRGRSAQRDLVTIRGRDALVRSRSQLINHVRGVVKSFGARLPSCDSGTFHRRAREGLPDDLTSILVPMIETIEMLTGRIKQYDKVIEQTAHTTYPEAEHLQQVTGVGPLTSLTFVLTLEDPSRFRKSRTVPAYLGLCPGRDQSGEHDPDLRISKAGDPFLRRLLVNAAHYILGPFGPDTDLRRWGLKLAERGGKNAKKRAVVATARKLAVLLHRLWVTGEVYVPVGYGEGRARKAA